MNNLEILVHRLGEEASLHEIKPQLLIQYLDLTSLNATDDEVVIENLCRKALQHSVAGVCAYPAFVGQVASLLKQSSIKVITVANFPHGSESLSVVRASIECALKAGAVECDVVIPYQAFLKFRDVNMLKDFVRSCKSLLPRGCLKVILESGAFHDDELLEKAALVCLEAGANFLKTSTGKISQGASLKAAAILIHAIKQFGDLKRGFKASGGVRHYEQAKMYYLLGKMMMGESWLNQNTFRIGASSLLDELVARMNR